MFKKSGKITLNVFFVGLSLRSSRGEQALLSTSMCVVVRRRVPRWRGRCGVLMWGLDFLSSWLHLSGSLNKRQRERENDSTDTPPQPISLSGVRPCVMRCGTSTCTSFFCVDSAHAINSPTSARVSSFWCCRCCCCSLPLSVAAPASATVCC